MAKVKFGSIITDSRGKIAGHALKWSRFGNVLLTKPSPTKRLTSHRSLAHVRFAEFSRSWWATLTPTQRTGWRELAADNPYSNVWGDEFPLSGLAYYIKINARMRTAGETPFLDAPADQVVTPLSTFSCAATAPNTLALTFTPSTTPADHRLYVFATENLSPGIQNFDGKFFFIVAAPLAQTSPYTIGTIYTTRLAPLRATNQIAVRGALLNIDNGALSPFILATDTID
jgi:hypothetical protein